MPPAVTPRIATAMMTTKSGNVALIEGSVTLNGSNDTVTSRRLATANTTKTTLSGISTRAVKNLRMRLSRVGGDRIGWRVSHQSGYRFCDALSIALRAGVSRFSVAVQPFAHFLAGLEKRHALLIDRDMGAGAWIAAGAGGAMLDRERAKSPKLDPVPPRQHNLVENGVHDVFNVPLVEMRVVLGDTLNEF